MGIRDRLAEWIGKGVRDRITTWMMPWIGTDAIKEGDTDSLLRAYRSLVYTFSNKNATSVASVPLNLYVAKRAGKKLIVPTKSITPTKKLYLSKQAHLSKYIRKATEYEEVTDHQFIDLTEQVNPFMNQFTLFEMTELHLELTGNAYWYVVKDGLGLPVEIWPLNPSRVTVIPHPKDFISGYRYRMGTDKIVFEESDIIHYKFPHPFNDYYGMGVVEAVSAAYNINEQMAAFDSRTLKNGGRIDGYFSHTGDKRLSETEFNRIKKEIEENYTGAGNNGKNPLLDGLEYKAFALPPKELNFVQGRKWTKEEICNAFGQSVGMWDKDATRSNSENATYMFMKDTILPRLCRIEQKINEKLLPMYDGDLFCAFDNPVPEDREFRLKERESNLKTGYSSINIERQIDNQEDVEWGEIPLMPMGIAPLGAPPAQPHEPDEPIEEPVEEPEEEAAKSLKKKDDWRKKEYDAFIKATDPLEADWIKEMRKLFADQEKEVLANMKKTPKAMLKGNDVTGQWMFGRKTWERRFGETGSKLLKAAVAVNGARVMDALPVVGISFDVLNDAVIEWIKGTAIDHAKEIVQTTTERITRVMNAGLEAGESIPDIAKRVTDEFSKMDKYRATVIARTETTGAANFGTKESYRQSGVVEKKEWLATMDMRVRDSHAGMDGEQVNMDENFSNGLDFPGDPGGEASEVVNCRCTMVPVIIEGNE